MKRKLSVVLSLVLIAALCLLSLPSCASRPHEFRSGNFKYTVENKEVTITEYIGNDLDVTVPETIMGMPVVAIGDSAFHNCSEIESVSIPDSVVKIGSLVFNKCYSLERVTLGNGVREIDFSPFANCRKMTYNQYENGNYIGNDENPYLALVSMISEERLESITVHPDTVVVCGSAMENCVLVQEIVFPEGIVSIGSFAMQNCSSLEKVYIPRSVESIGLLVFDDCNALCEIVVSDENTCYKSVEGSLFSRDGATLIKYALGQKVSSYSIPEGTVIVGRSAFEKAKYLTEVVIPDSVQMIEHSAFIHCENLVNIRFGNGLKEIGGVAFGFCGSLTQVTIPDSVEKISYSVFSNCEKLESAVIGSGVVDMDSEVFIGCDSLNSVVFRDPEGWSVKNGYSFFSEKIDLSDPKQNASYLVDDYCEYYYWYKE